MIIIDQILIILLFLGPGFLIGLIRPNIIMKQRKEKQDLFKYVEAAVLSACVLVFNLFLLWLVQGIWFDNISILVSTMKQTNFLLSYILITLLSSIIVLLVHEYVYERGTKYLKNKYYRFKKKSTTVSDNEVWDEILSSLLDTKDPIISIHKDGTMISQGRLIMFNLPGSKENAFILDQTSRIWSYMEDDKSKPLNKKIFPVILYEYYNLDTGISIKFYDPYWFLEKVYNEATQ